MPKKKSSTLFFIYLFIFLTLFILLIEIILNLYGKSLCTARACEITEFLTVIPKRYLLVIAGLYFFSLFLITWIYNSTGGSFFINLLILFLSAGLMAEGVFAGRLLLDYQILCYFCFLIGGLLLLLSLLYLNFFSQIPLKAYTLLCSFIGALAGLFLALKITSLSGDLFGNLEKRYYLIYSDECARCQELLANMHINDIEKIPLQRGFPLLRTLRLSTLPVLLEKEGKTWKIYSDPEDMEKILVGKPLKTNPRCDNETEGGICVLP